jgi:HD-like signal output (HDOD) protein
MEHTGLSLIPNTEGLDYDLLKEIVAWVGNLPPLPPCASRVMALLNQPHVSLELLEETIRQDPALTARILRVANSPVFLRQRQIATLSQAFMVIGLRGLQGIIAASMLQGLTAANRELRSMIWQRSLFTGLCAYRIATKLKMQSPGEVFIFGLLHNLGQLVLLTEPARVALFEQALEVVTTAGVEFIEAERRVLGVTHTYVGALVAKKWELPPSVVRTILHYRDPIDFPLDDAHEARVAAVQLAEQLCHHSGIGSPQGYPCDTEEINRLATGLGLSLNLDGTGVPPFLETVILHFEGCRGSFDA